VQQFLDKIQDVASRQVIIEAKIVEVELSSAFRAGINWAAIAQQGAVPSAASKPDRSRDSAVIICSC